MKYTVIKENSSAPIKVFPKKSHYDALVYAAGLEHITGIRHYIIGTK